MAATPSPTTRRLPQGAVWDVAVAAAIVAFALLALQLSAAISGLGEMADGIRQTGAAIQSSGRATAKEIEGSVGGAADALQGVPFVGAEVARRVREAARRSAEAVERESRIDGARLVDAGRQGREQASTIARPVGWLAFLIPTVLLLAVWIPRRIEAWSTWRSAWGRGAAAR